MRPNILLSALCIHMFAASNVYSSKILGLFPFEGTSHFVVIKALITELARRGHEVTSITHFHIDEQFPNYKEILIEDQYPFWEDVYELFNKKTVLELADLSVGQFFDMVHLIGIKTSEHALQNHRVQEFLQNKDHKFDLVITEQFFQESFLAIPYVLKVPVIALATCTIDNYVTNFAGMINPYSHVPLLYLPYSDRMNFKERLINTYWSLLVEYKRHYEYFPQHDMLVKKYFGHYGEELPPVAEMEKNISLILANNYVPLDISRPQTMSLVQVGGIHIKQPKELPPKLKEFIDNSPKGVIYMNLGTQVKSSDMPEETVQALLKVFGSLKLNVLWKWEDENIPSIPKNVLVRKWFAQSDILAHPYIRVFITHGGLLGFQEAVQRSVPVIGIPIYCDQHKNVETAVRGGYGIRIDFHNITEASMSWAINTILKDRSYADNMREASRIFRDRPLSAMETAIYWIDYVIKYKGAPHIKSYAVYLPWYTLYLLDIIAFLLAILLGFVGVIYAAVKIRVNTKSKEREKFHKLH